MKKMMIMAMFLAGALSATIARAADPVHYLTWDSSQGKLVDAVCTEYTVVTESTDWLREGRWYVVNSTVTCKDRIDADDGAHLILCDGAKLTAQEGIATDSDEPLWIHGQSKGTGVLEATGSKGEAGIGGRYVMVVIEGGIIRANGGLV